MSSFEGCRLLPKLGHPFGIKFQWNFFPQFLVIKTLDPDPHSLEMLDPDPDSLTTLVFLWLSSFSLVSLAHEGGCCLHFFLETDFFPRDWPLNFTKSWQHRWLTWKDWSRWWSWASDHAQSGAPQRRGRSRSSRSSQRRGSSSRELSPDSSPERKKERVPYSGRYKYSGRPFRRNI